MSGDENLYLGSIKEEFSAKGLAQGLEVLNKCEIAQSKTMNNMSINITLCMDDGWRP